MKKRPFVLAGGLVATLLLVGAGCSAYTTPNTNVNTARTMPATNAASINPNALNANAATTNVNASASTRNINSAASTTMAVAMQNFAFSPADVDITAGTTVTWTNLDSVAHTVIGDNGGPASGTISPQGTYSYTFSTPGSYAYHCSVHPTMTGTVTVAQ